MKWPDASDYQNEIQNPRVCFQDPELKAAKVALTPLGLPRVASGYFANVYELRNGSRRWAVRCFQHEISDQQRRYALLSQHLSLLKLPSLVEFEYLTQGIRVHGQWYPVVKMEWVDGERLDIYVARHIHDGKTLLDAAAQWRGLVNSLRGNRLAHGDLQHGNVLVNPQGQIRLVDYDAMFVPSLTGSQSSELGLANYQHPKRTPDVYDGSLDNFAAIVIYLSLRTLAFAPSLWQQFHTGENLILSAGDFKAPQHSPVFRVLRGNPDVGVQNLTAALERCCLAAVSQIPDFETTVSSLPTPQNPPTRSGSSASNAASSHTAPPWWSNAPLGGPSGAGKGPTNRIDSLKSRWATIVKQAEASLPHKQRNILPWLTLLSALLLFMPAYRKSGGGELLAIVLGVITWWSYPASAKRERQVAASAIGLGGWFGLLWLSSRYISPPKQDMVARKTWNERIDYSREEVQSPALTSGRQRITQNGRSGWVKVTADITYRANQELSRRIIKKEILVNPLAEIVLVGTGAPSPQPYLETKSIPFGTERWYSNELQPGQRRIRRKGQDGKKTVTWEVTLKNGSVVGRKLIGQSVIANPVSQIVLIGTKRPPPEPQYCPECSAPRVPHARFCPSCGHEF